jgi:hypothetical protein
MPYSAVIAESMCFIETKSYESKSHEYPLEGEYRFYLIVRG